MNVKAEYVENSSIIDLNTTNIIKKKDDEDSD